MLCRVVALTRLLLLLLLSSLLLYIDFVIVIISHFFVVCVIQIVIVYFVLLSAGKEGTGEFNRVWLRHLCTPPAPLLHIAASQFPFILHNLTDADCFSSCFFAQLAFCSTHIFFTVWQRHQPAPLLHSAGLFEHFNVFCTTFLGWLVSFSCFFPSPSFLLDDSKWSIAQGVKVLFNTTEVLVVALSVTKIRHGTKQLTYSKGKYMLVALV